MHQQTENEDPANQLKTLQLIAGADKSGQPVFEAIKALPLEEEGRYQLASSPLFLRNMAKDDIVEVDRDNPASIKVLNRSGNLAVRLFSKSSISALQEKLTPEVEKQGGSLDIINERALVYSIHVNIGFGSIESMFDSVMAEFRDSVWYYGNVYDPADGVTPLNWWDEFINQV